MAPKSRANRTQLNQLDAMHAAGMVAVADLKLACQPCNAEVLADGLQYFQFCSRVLGFGDDRLRSSYEGWFCSLLEGRQELSNQIINEIMYNLIYNLIL